MNPAAKLITGWSSHKAIGQPLVKVFPVLEPTLKSPGKIMTFKDFLPEDGSGERRFQNLTLLCHNQIHKIITCTINLMLGSEQQILGFTIVFQDITEQQQHQAQGIAHEINTPMQYVGDNIYFFKDVWADLTPLMQKYRQLVNECEQVGEKIELIQEIHYLEQQIDLDYVQLNFRIFILKSQTGKKPSSM